ncbi:LytR C-terminal domain-containing protein [Kribbella sp. VKM Ac-2568]|uniref:LytR C-terminal domain-containing protein n=1 Tax=Kribbella sp. VKM Ac-2568 TaxID=2512219 RepID=UPI001F540039|nr:LytR C-terminal domain-containing protein [Kribbella sp. VKM Ac-2568]
MLRQRSARYLRRSKDERGQVLSSLVAVLAAVAIVGGLLFLFGTRGSDSAADTPVAKTSSSSPTPASPASTSAPTSVPTTEPSSEPSSVPSSAPSSAPASEPTPTTAPSTGASIPPSERPAVEMYNNTSRKGLAEDVSIRARQAGWTVAGADNWHGKIVGSTVYYPPGMQSEAAQLAKDIGISRTKDALPNMKKDRLTVILTTDYAG